MAKVVMEVHRSQYKNDEYSTLKGESKMIKRITLPVVSAVVMLLMTGAAQAASIVPNGTFESPDDLTGWLQFPSGGTIGIAVDNGPSAPGTQSAQLVADASGGPSFPQIKVERVAPGLLTNGAPVTVSFDARAPIQTVDINAGTQVGNVVFIAELFSEFTGAGATNEILFGPPTFLTEDWVTYTFNTTLGADVSGGVSLLFKADCGANANCRFTANIDNVSIDTAVIPVPAAVWLFGSALGVLGWLRRRVS
jgi:hypothetical protein